MSGKGGKRPTYGQRLPRVMNTGYVRVYEPTHPLAKKDGYVLEHRKVVYDTFGDIPTGLIVHHKDGNKANNDLSNLELMTRLEHQRHHLARYATPADKNHAAYLRKKAKAGRGLR